MRPVIAVEAIFIKIFFTSYSFADQVEVLVAQYEPSVTLPEEELTYLRSLDSKHLDAAVKRSKDLYKLKDEKNVLEAKNDELQKKSPVFMFNCAVTNAKSTLQSFKDIVRTIPMHDDIIRCPLFHEALIIKQSSADKYTDVSNFRNRIKRWYNFINNPKCWRAEAVKGNLEKYQRHHTDKYETLPELHADFCASVSRLTFLFNHISHSFFPEMRNANEEDHFFDFLQKTVPFYYVDETDIDFLNILTISESIRKINKDNLYKYAKTSIKLEVLKDIPDSRRKNIIVVPQSTRCLNQKIDTTLFMLPFTTLQ